MRGGRRHAARVSAQLACLCVALAGCAGRQAPTSSQRGALPATDVLHTEGGSERAPAPPKIVPRGHTRPVTSNELRAIDALMRDAERVRELSFTREVDVIVQDAAAIEAYVESEIEPEHVEEASVLYGALGLIDPAIDLRALWLRLMSEQVVGYYDIDHGRLSIREDVMRAFEDAGGGRVKKRSRQALGRNKGGSAVDLEEARVVLIHELVHALQDQHLDLAKTMKQERDTDGENALRALVEGDATLAMVSYVFEREGVPLHALTRDPARVRGLSNAVTAPMQGTELAKAPAIVRVSLMSAYVDGLSFAAALHGAGGFSRLNRAYAELPASSEQVLHPERFVRGEAVLRIALPDARSLLGEGYELVVEDTLGELELSVYFGTGAREAVARRAADGWNGDRVYVFRGAAGALSAVWITSWDDERHATEAEAAARAVINAALPAERASHAVFREEDAVLITRGVTPEQLEAVRGRFSAWVGRGKSSLVDAKERPARPGIGPSAMRSLIERPSPAW
jgi:hypothetical protein